MNRVFLLFHNLCRWVVNKLRYGGRYQASPLQKISLLATVALHCRGRVRLGTKVELSAGTDIQVYGDGSLEIGDRVYMNRYCMVSCLGRVRIGAGTLIGPGVRIFDNNHRFGKEGVSIEVKAGEIEIGENCWIASNVVLLKGARIGSNSVIGAGCVIDYEVPPRHSRPQFPVPLLHLDRVSLSYRCKKNVSVRSCAYCTIEKDSTKKYKLGASMYFLVLFCRRICLDYSGSGRFHGFIPSFFEYSIGSRSVIGCPDFFLAGISTRTYSSH